MEGVKLNVKALAAMMDLSIEGLAKLAGLSVGHLESVSSGRVEMTANDLMMLSEVTGVDPHNIKWK